MNSALKEGLDPACITLELKAKDRDNAIRELVECIHQHHHLNNFDEALQIVMDRERKMSTSLENGLAVPHGKVPSVNQLFVAVGLKKKGIDFKSADGQPSNIIILILSDASKTGPHMRCLAEIGRLLQSEENRTKILNAKDAESVYQILTEPGD